MARLIYISFLLAGVVMLAVISVFNISDYFGWGLLILWIIIWYVLWRNNKDKQIKFYLIDWWWTVPLWVVLLSRFPIYYPVYDDFAFHLEAGWYAKNIWQAVNFLPLDFGSYIYPVAQLGYPLLLKVFGIRLSLLFNGILLIAWYASINLRLKQVEKNNNKKIWWDIIFIYIFFVPHLMATHTTFMVDFLTLVLGLEMFYQLVVKTGNRTLGVIVGLLSMIIKQSAGIVLMPIFLYFVWQNKREIKWFWVILIVLFVFIFFGASYINTGNPISFLYNGFFKSPFYALVSFKDTRWGPQNWQEILAWPVMAQFTQRFGEGIVKTEAKYFFACFWAFPYLLSWYLLLIKRKWKYIIFIFCYLIWSVLMGYSRYLLTFAAVYWLYLVYALKLNYSLRLKRWWLLFVVFVILCFTSVSTDFGWRPNLIWLQNTANRPFFIKTYIDSLKLLGEDRLDDMVNGYESIIGEKETVVVAFRGPESFFAYLASYKGANIVNAVDETRYVELINSKLVSENFKLLLKRVDTEKSILIIGDKQWLSIEKIYWNRNRVCKKLELDKSAWYFQSLALFENTLIYRCTRTN